MSFSKKNTAIIAVGFLAVTLFALCKTPSCTSQKTPTVQPCHDACQTVQKSSQKESHSVQSIQSLTELDTYVQNNDRVIVDVYAPWCGPCKKFAPDYEAFAAKHPEIVCLKIDGDAYPAITKKYAINGYPSFLVFKNKKKINQFTGASNSVARFEERVKELLTP